MSETSKRGLGIALAGLVLFAASALGAVTMAGNNLSAWNAANAVALIGVLAILAGLAMSAVGLIRGR